VALVQLNIMDVGVHVINLNNKNWRQAANIWIPSHTHTQNDNILPGCGSRRARDCQEEAGPCWLDPTCWPRAADWWNSTASTSRQSINQSFICL